ncbi:MAG: hypothetical protein AB7F86_09840 [Bdellovibrionales bacterium]
MRILLSVLLMGLMGCASNPAAEPGTRGPASVESSPKGETSAYNLNSLGELDCSTKLRPPLPNPGCSYHCVAGDWQKTCGESWLNGRLR